jgi:hypothetical protein
MRLGPKYRRALPRSHHKCPGGSGRSLPVAHALARPQTGLDCEHHQLGPVACVSFNIAGLTCASARCRGSTSSSAISWLERPVATHSMISRPRRPDPQPRVWLLARPDVPHSSMTRRVTEGANGEPSSTTTRIASSSLAGSASLSRRQLAPARRASKTYSSSSKVVGHDHAHAGQVGIRGRLGQQTQAVEDRPPDVASAHVGPGTPDKRRPAPPVCGLAYDLGVLRAADEGGLGVAQHVGGSGRSPAATLRSTRPTRRRGFV